MKLKRSTMISAMCGPLVALLIAIECQAQTTSGIPEPGVCLYGAVANTNGYVPSLGAGVTLSITDGSSTVHLTSSLVTVNGQVFFVARVPFETRTIPGGPTFSATSNTFELAATSTPYTCSATLNGTNVTLQNPASFTSSRAERGRVVRLDLIINAPQETFAQWSQRVLGLVADPNADPLGKGMTYYQQYIAGTDPLDPNSIFKFINIAPAEPAGIAIQWSAVVGKTYTIQRSYTAGTNFAQVGSVISATSTNAQYTDTTATGTGPFFYRLKVQ